MFDIKNEDELKKIIKSKDNYIILMEKYYNSKKMCISTILKIKIINIF